MDERHTATVLTFPSRRQAVGKVDQFEALGLIASRIVARLREETGRSATAIAGPVSLRAPAGRIVPVGVGAGGKG